MKVSELKKVLQTSDNIVFFGGAGVSTESSIPDFRSAEGLYNERTNSNYAPEEILSGTFFREHTTEFFHFYKTKMIYQEAKPNRAHQALAQLGDEGRLRAVITQNIDGLHQKAGSKNVLELHGSIGRNYCMKCRKFFTLDFILKSDDIPRCDVCGGTIKPDVILYEEMLDNSVLERAIEYIEKAEVLIVGGTSLTVYPAAGLITYYQGNRLVLINKDTTPYDYKANLLFYGQIGEILHEALQGW